MSLKYENVATPAANMSSAVQQSRQSLPANTSHSQSQSQPQPQPQPQSQSQSQSQAQQQSQPSQHKRVYQACIPCRRRKVRCDLGSVDNPHDPPCVRCRRESKECFFSATRRKRKNDDDIDDQEDDYTVRNARKRLHTDDTPPLTVDRKSYSSVPLTPGGSNGRTQPLKRPNSDREDGRKNSRGTSYTDLGEDSNAQLENLEAQSVMRKEVYGPHDALDLLYKAATDSPHDLNRRHESLASVVQPSPVSVPGRKTPRDHGSSLNGRPVGRATSKSADLIDPLLQSSTKNEEVADMERRLNVENEAGYQEALEAWSRFRFVRAGWFTKEEAISYYEYLSPMTPISPPTFRSPSSHITLLTEEPILTVTLLTIASRYYRIRTTGGHCRSHAIHEELWRYLRRMIERCLWGQEAFGGGFCGSGADESQTSSTAPWRGLRKGSLRTLGTIESLMILTEWHPRALHFPPEEAIDELMLPVRGVVHPDGGDDEGAQRVGGNVGGRRIESWLEPAWRSDRMCWMLLSNALGLAYELGVFDDIDELLATNAITRPEYEDEAYRLRATRIKRLLLVYLTQLAGRLGWTNMVPESIRKNDPALTGRRPISNEGNTPGTNQSILSNAFSYVPNVELDDQIIHCWVGVSDAMQLGNERLFRSRKHTTEIIQSGNYTRALKEFQPILKNWWREFQRFDMPENIRHILTIEYEYVRIYVNSLALQAVVERCTVNAGATTSAGHGGNVAVGNPQLSPQTQNYLGNLPLGHLGGFGHEDQEYVKEVVDGCRNLLRTVVEGLLKEGYLKHAPVRTYFRIISGAMFLLKTFALGAPKSDVEMSISLLDRTVDALRNCVVDDIHLGTRFGDLLESLTTRLRDRFKYAPATTSGEGKSPRPNGDAGKATATNGHIQANGFENGYLSHTTKFRDGLSVPERSSTPSGNVSATPFDLTTGNFPYPAGSASVFGPATPALSGHVLETSNLGENIFEASADWSSDDQMWYLPPGPGLFQNMGENSNVTMTDQGVNVGGVDLLEFMAMDPPSFTSPMDGQGY
ncbi:zinc finger transcriptional activator [Parahypoxylon ruwenzoriense]